MQPFSDLNAILQSGYSFQCKTLEGLSWVQQMVTISTHQIGELIVTSGTILAWDLLIGPDSRYCFKKTIKPGHYPVILSVADFQPADYTRIACAMMRISDEPTSYWEAAVMNNPDPNQASELFSYGVDSGTGCFMDCDAVHAVDYQFSSLDKFQGFCDQICAEMAKNSFSKHSAGDWTEVRAGDDTEANIIVFSSGWGDGGYASFWGYSATGNLTSLITDFALFPEDGEA